MRCRCGHSVLHGLQFLPCDAAVGAVVSDDDVNVDPATVPGQQLGRLDALAGLHCVQTPADREVGVLPVPVVQADWSHDTHFSSRAVTAAVAR